MITIYVSTDKELKNAIEKFGNTKNVAKIVDLRPNNNKDKELDRHVQEVEEERVKDTGQL
jgi:hypothetical protein|tara:strand:- start:301 stop:480 length:180 start_codon:yes stop_codon:yes gene_type:complete